MRAHTPSAPKTPGARRVEPGGAEPGGAEPEGFLDERRFELLFRECAGDLHGYAISLLGDRAAAEDVTALAFERLYRSRSKLDIDRGTPRALLFAIARNACLDELRRRRRRPHDELRDELIQDRAAGEAFERLERRATVSAALAALPPRDREVVLLKFHGQLSNAELARALGVSDSNAATRLHRALTTLRLQSARIDGKEVA